MYRIYLFACNLTCASTHELASTKTASIMSRFYMKKPEVFIV